MRNIPLWMALLLVSFSIKLIILIGHLMMYGHP